MKNHYIPERSTLLDALAIMAVFATLKTEPLCESECEFNLIINEHNLARTKVYGVMKGLVNNISAPNDLYARSVDSILIVEFDGYGNVIKAIGFNNELAIWDMFKDKASISYDRLLRANDRIILTNEIKNYKEGR